MFGLCYLLTHVPKECIFTNYNFNKRFENIHHGTIIHISKKKD